MRIHYLQHVPFEGPASIAAWAVQRGHTLTGSHLLKGEPLPGLNDFDWLVVMGGFMSVHDEAEFPWLVPEKKLIGQAIERGKRVLGVCLGAQLLADALGARVCRAPEKEIGWFPVRRTVASAASPSFRNLPDEFTAFHWHGDTFDLPRGAAHLAGSEACPNQAFAYGSALALQFHVESTPESIAALIRNCPGDLRPGRYVQSPEQIMSYKGFEPLGRILSQILDGLANG